MCSSDLHRVVALIALDVAEVPPEERPPDGEGLLRRGLRHEDVGVGEKLADVPEDEGLRGRVGVDAPAEIDTEPLDLRGLVGIDEGGVEGARGGLEEGLRLQFFIYIILICVFLDDYIYIYTRMHNQM